MPNSFGVADPGPAPSAVPPKKLTKAQQAAANAAAAARQAQLNEGLPTTTDKSKDKWTDPNRPPATAAPPPAAGPAPTPYTYSGAEGNSVVTISGVGLGGDLARVFPGQAAPQSRQVTVNELEAEFWALPAYQRLVIEKELYAAGFFQPTFKPADAAKLGSDVVDADVATALKNAAMAASTSGQEFSSMLTNAAATGQPPAGPKVSPVLGHGPNDVIDLTNPDQVRALAQSVFEKALGRDPTDAELAAATSAIQSQEIAAGTAKNAVGELTAQQEFAAKEADRNQQYALATGTDLPNTLTPTPVAGSNPQDAGLAGLGTGAGTAQAATTTAAPLPAGATAAPGGGQKVGIVTLATTPKGAPGVAAFLAATIAHESIGAGQYTALNPGSKAGGAYQFLPSTWMGPRGVATQAGYPQYANMAPNLVPPAIQDAVAAWYATELYAQSGGNWAKVAKAWYGGPGKMNSPDGEQPNSGLSLGAYASFVTNYMAKYASPGDPQSAGLAGLGTGAGTQAGSQPTGGGGYVNPLSQGSWGLARTDMGVDYIPKTPSPILALGDGVVIKSTPVNSGWPGASGPSAGAWLAYRLTDGPAAGQVVYVAENLTGVVPVGTQVKAGQQIAVGNPGYPYIETGWANSSGTSPIVTYGKNPDGTPMTGGIDFARLMIKLGAGAMQNPGPGEIFPGGPDSSTISGGTAVTNTPGDQSSTSTDPNANDIYTKGSVTPVVSAADAQSEVFKVASTGANTLPFGAENMISAIGNINTMIRANR